MTDTERWIFEWIEKKGKLASDESPSDMEINYFEAGWIDSILFIMFLNDIEEKFGIEFYADEFLDRRFSTIKGISALIDAKRSRT